MSVNPPAVTPRQIARRLVVLLPVLAIILIYTVAQFAAKPFVGFELAGDEIVAVHSADKSLQIGDRLIRVKDILIADFNRDLFKTICDDVQVGDIVKIEIERDRVLRTIYWIVPDTIPNQFLFRAVITHWWLAFVFLICGVIVLWRTTRHDALQHILISFFFIMAIMISTSSVAWWHVWGSAVMFRSSIWIALPIALHLHWNFPKPLAPLPSGIKYAGYAASVLAAFAEVFRQLPANAYIIAFAVAMVGSWLMHFVRLFTQKDQRRDTLLLFASLSIPSVALGITSLITLVSAETPLTLLAVGFYALGIIPITYTYVSNRHRPGFFEVQFNQLTALNLFISIVLLTLAIANEIVYRLLGTLTFAGITPLFTFAGFFLGAMLTAYIYPRFNKMVEQRLLGVPVSPVHIVESFASSVSRVNDAADLARLLQNIVAPSLLIHRSALVLIQNQPSTALYLANVQASDLPTDEEFTSWKDRSTIDPAAFSPRRAWLQLALPIKHNDQLLGYWLLGLHGSKPDYDAAEIATLNALAHFIGVALSQVIRSKNLRALYQEYIDRNEAYRAAISRELHDSTAQFKFLKEEIAQLNPSPEFFVRWDKAVNDIRHAIYDLRPTMLDFGLGPALWHLRDQLEEQSNNGAAIELNVNDNGDRYEPDVEQHIYQIIRQACLNALEHARATRITIEGLLEPRGVEVTVTDDGVGFRFRGDSDLAAFIADHRFGMAGMFERAHIIRADLSVESVPGQGTRIQLKWAL